jgi:hypothetical protein
MDHLEPLDEAEEAAQLAAALAASVADSFQTEVAAATAASSEIPVASEDTCSQAALAASVADSFQTEVAAATAASSEIPVASEDTCSQGSWSIVSESLVDRGVEASVAGSSSTGGAADEEVVDGAQGERVPENAFAHLIDPPIVALDFAVFASRRGLRYYAVWCAPGGDQRVIGVHISEGSRGWYRLVAYLYRGRYTYFDGTRLRRLDSLAKAIELYSAESVRLGNRIPPLVFHWR